MALNKYISVKICGNPASNSGFYPIVSFNSPSFAIEDEFYVGFDNCFFFYTIKTTETQTIYKLVKNNVRSYGAIRPGSLVIAFSIPKNYVLDNGYTPYDVLSKLKDEFLKRCMTCKDPVRETYEFNKGLIDPKILDDVAREFSITQKICPNRVMNPNAPKGYVVKNDVEIGILFHDTNYPEFDKFSEVIIAESVTQTNYMPISNIQVPRRINYAIYVDGVYKESCDDLDTQLTASSKKSEKYYENKKVHFTIQELKNGNYFEGIVLKELEEQIDISTLNWAKPRSEKLRLLITAPKNFSKFTQGTNFIKVECTFGQVRLNSDFSFTLIGEQIAEKAAIRYSLTESLKGKYKISSSKIEDDIVRIVIEEVRETSSVSKFPSPVYDNDSSVIDVQILIEDLLKLTGNLSIIKTRLKADTLKEETICLQLVSFHEAMPNRKYEGHFYIPKKYQGYIEFSIKDNIWKSRKITPMADTWQLEEKDFIIKKKNFFKRNCGFIKIFVFALLVFVPFVLGFVLHDPIKSLFATTNTNQASNDTITSNETLYSHMTDDEAYEFLDNAKVRLQAKDVNFNEIVDFYQKFMGDSVTLKQQDALNFQNKICNQIKDYYAISNDIKNGNYEKLKDDISHMNDFHIWPTHANIIRLITKDENTYRNNYSNFNSFLDIASTYKTFSGNGSDMCSETSANSAELNNHRTQEEKYRCEICQKEFDNNKKLKSHIPEHFKCNINKCNKKFNSAEELASHKKAIHLTER